MEISTPSSKSILFINAYMEEDHSNVAAAIHKKQE
jgi:hypothetical protein